MKKMGSLKKSDLELSKVSSLQKRFRIKRQFLLIVWVSIFTYYFIGSFNNDFSRNKNKFCVSGSSLSNYSPPNWINKTGVEINGGKMEEINPQNNKTKTKSSVKPKFLRMKEKKYANSELPGVNCTPPGIDDFPEDMFTDQQRSQGWIIVHFLVSLYIFCALALVCDDYFVPSMECICEELKMPSDVAGATFMAIATSAPELFTNIIGTFITKGDIGIGAIVGSAVFNILAVVAVCGLGAGMVVPLEWYSITRDCFFYSLSVILLIGVLRDERIYWYEALILVSVYLLYIIGMYNNSRLKRKTEKLVYKIQKRFKNKKGGPDKRASYVLAPLNEGLENSKNGKLTELKASQILSEIQEAPDELIDEAVDVYNDEIERKEMEVVEEVIKKEELEAEEERNEFDLCTLPFGFGSRVWVEWFLFWPIRAIYKISVPDCREGKWRRWYPLTFFMCIMWIGVLSYVVNWMMTIIGHTFKIPDSVMGLTFIAAGTSIPEVVSSLIVSRQGQGTMALSNSIGSNTFDILICLGLPWLIRSSHIAKSELNFIKINSIGLEYSAMMLITSLIVLYIILACNKYVLDRKVGFISLILYALFLLFASLFELNVFFTVNLPTCLYHED